MVVAGIHRVAAAAIPAVAAAGSPAVAAGTAIARLDRQAAATATVRQGFRVVAVIPVDRAFPAVVATMGAAVT